MINKKTREISISDIQELITLKVPESKTIEYKKELKIGTDAEKKEFLADVSSFANTSGGDLLFGIKAVSGIPESMIPLKMTDLDSEQLRIENIIRTGIDPRISFTVKPISTEVVGEYILLIRVEESWNKPHRVIYAGGAKFYARNSAGKYELDVEELRNAFNLSSGLLEKINNFRIERTIQIESAPDGVFVSPYEGKVIMQIIPIESFANKISVSTQELVDMYMDRSKPDNVSDCFRPPIAGGWSHKITPQGVMSYYSGAKNGIREYVELYKNGIVEVVRCDTVGTTTADEGKFLSMKYLENVLLDCIPRYLKLQKFLNIQTPSYIFITLTGVKNCKVARPSFYSNEDDYPISKEILYLPEAIIQSYDDDLAKILKPSFDIVWNHTGIIQSPNYDKDGNFITK